MRVVVIDYNGGNLASAAQAARKAALRKGIEADVVISRDATDILEADRLILPGQGAFADCAKGLGPDLRNTIETATVRGTPFLGICVGMQLMSEYGLEHGRTEGLAGFRAISGAWTKQARLACACRTWAGTRWISSRAHTC